jgi:hypothetical protein
MEPRVTSASPALDAALDLARTALRQHPECFWTRAPHAPLETRDDVALVVRRLRQHGSVAAWQCANEIERCL